ncbi:MAG: hypothetical protein LBS99_02410, partial [Clostridiales bacterium]|nr:hypothetical protein [Clostridiales bacterium]
INGQNIKYVVNALSEAFDYVLLDCPAGIEAGFHRAVAAASEAIVVTTPHISAIRDAGKVLSILDTYEIAPIGLVVNRARGDLMLNMEMPDICDIRELLGREVTGVIPEDDIVSASTSAGRLVPEYSAAADAYGLFAKNVIEGTRLIYDCTARYRGVFGRMRRGLRKIT